MNRYKEILSDLAIAHNLRSIPSDTVGMPLVDLSTNDYLGIGTSAALRREFMQSLGDNIPSFTSSASRLLAAPQQDYSNLEQLLSSVYGRSILLFNSGYHANVGSISALADDKTLIVADKLVHASIIDGAMLSRARMERFRHNDVNHLEAILARQADKFSRILIVTESVFSMDGDLAPLNDIIAVKRRYPHALLYVDEAHAFGVVGEKGLGLCAGRDEVDLIIGTFGKALASVGAFVATSDTLRSFLVNKARSFIFSTAIPPFNCAWTSFVITKMMAMDDERHRLKRLGMLLQKVTSASSAGHIQPMVTGSAESALALSSRLLAEGFKVLPIRTPTVPPGTERLRFSLSLDVTDVDIQRLAKIDMSI